MRLRAGIALLSVSATAAIAAGQDCNGNGRPDWLDLQAGFDMGTARTYFMGATPQRQVIADLNADGRPDIAAALALAECAAVLMNEGERRFTPAAIYATDGRAFDVVAGRFNNDSFLDLALSVDTPDQVQVFNGDGAGGFVPGQKIAMSEGPRALAAADLDNDGDTDLIVARPTDSIQVIANNGVNLVILGTVTAVGFTVGDLQLAELTADAFIDAAVVFDTGSQTHIWIRRNDGASNLTFTDIDTVALPRGVNALTVANVDGDADMDLLATNTSARTVTVLLNNGAGDFTAGPVLSTAPTPGPVAAADINGDSLTDLIVSNRNTTAPLDVYMNSGGASFGAAVGLEAPGLMMDAALHDMDGDGDNDLVTISSRTAGAAVFENSGASIVAELNAIPLASGAFSVVAANLDSDPDVDVAVTNTNSETLMVFRNNAGTLEHLSSYPVGGDPTFVASGDFDGVNGIDFATASTLNGSVSILLNNGDASYAAATHAPVAVTLNGIVAANLDADADLELATVTPGVGSGAGTVYILDNDGSGGFSVADSFPAGEGAAVIRAGDLNHDGWNDLAVANFDADDVSVYLNDGGVFPTHDRYTVDPKPFALDIADFNGDGDGDLVVLHLDLSQTTQNVAVLLNDGAGAFPSVDRYPANGGGISVSAGDFDNDGDADFAALAGPTGDLIVYANLGDGTFFHAGSFFVGENPFGFAIADLDGDGRLEAVCSDSLGGRLSAPTLVVSVPVSQDSNGNNIPDECECVGDLNGDRVVGVEDLAQMLSNYGIVEGATPEQGDVDGDGDIDIGDLALLLTAFGSSC